jgi:spore germination protein KA
MINRISGGYLMQLKNWFKKLTHFGAPKDQFSLGDQSWERPDLSKQASGEKLDRSLTKNRIRLEKIFELPTNQDIVIRDFTIPGLNLTAFIIYIDGLTDRYSQCFAVLQPLMILSGDGHQSQDPITTAYDLLIPTHQVQRSAKLKELVNGIMDGSTILIIDKSADALIIETKGWEHRGVEKPSHEPVVRGPQEAFNENFRASTASVRRYLKDPKLVTEIFRVGKRSNTLTAVMYIKDIANSKLVEEVKYRIQSIATTSDYIAETGALEEFIEDHPRTIVPQILSTERPDRLAAHLREGYVGIVMANSPYSLVVPTTFTIFLHAAEDHYLRWPFGNFLRTIRLIAIFLALLLPSFYIAVVNYHQEMIPTDLMLAMTAAREIVPFPAIIEILFMEFSFELIREAGVRVPSIIGPTIGIVGALILGQAAVAASIVSPVLIIIIAITALASFVVPNYNASFTIRILRFIFIIFAGILGFFGIAFGVFVMALHIASLNSFGVPFLSPITPYRPENKDQLFRPRAFRQPKRPVYLRPLDIIRQTAIPRQWDRTPDQPDNADHKEPANGKKQ